jgi:hypothetical protein
LTRANPLKRGFALIDASDTGGTGRTGATITASPFASATARAMPTTDFSDPVW